VTLVEGFPIYLQSSRRFRQMEEMFAVLPHYIIYTTGNLCSCSGCEEDLVLR